MKSPFSIRLWILIAALLLVAGGTVYGLFASWRHMRQLETQMEIAEKNSFGLADEFQRELLKLNDFLLRYTLTRDPRQWEQFDREGRDLDRWADDNDPGMNPNSPLTTDNERKIFTELNRAYDDYLNAARAVHSNAQPALVSSGEFRQLETFESQAERMRDLIERLAGANHSAEVGFYASAKAALSHLRSFLIASGTLLLALFAAMGWVFYRDTIAPLQSKLVHSQKLLERQEKLATLGTLAAGIAHEIRNPLTSLKARLYTLEKRLQTLPAAKKDTDIISAEISRLERIVQDILSFARPADPKLETIAAETLLREVHGLMAQSLESAGVQLMLESNPELLIRVDSGHLKQVLINLVRNAADAIDGAGTVTLATRASRARLGAHETDAVIIEVTDTGNGIPPEVEKRLFDPFFSTKETGTGLGLPIAVRIVERHGGTLQYQTRPGHGTTFGIVLPRQSAGSAQARQAPAP